MYHLYRQVTMPIITVLISSAFSTAQADLPYNIECIGFDYPMDEIVTVPVNKMRLALPLRASLKDAEGMTVTGSSLIARPVVQVMFFSSAPDGQWEDVSDLIEWINEDPDDGNEFVYMPESQEWHFKLSARPYSATGTYLVTMESGDEDEYLFPEESMCKAQFVREH